MYIASLLSYEHHMQNGLGSGTLKGMSMLVEMSAPPPASAFISFHYTQLSISHAFNGVQCAKYL